MTTLISNKLSTMPFLHLLKKGVPPLLGLTLVTFLISQTDATTLKQTVTLAAPYFPVFLLLELLVLGCSLLGLWSLYYEDGFIIPTPALLRAGLISYAVMGLLPAGRTCAESTRAALLARYATGVHSAVAAVRLQAMALIATGLIGVPCVFILLSQSGLHLLSGAAIVNFFMTGALGSLFY